MPQLSIYLDREAQKKVEEAAKREGSSLSSWARERLVAAATPRDWPDGFFDLFGSITDEAFKAPDELDWQDDAAREEL